MMRCLRRATPTLDFKDCRYNISDRTCIELINIVISKSALRRVNFRKAVLNLLVIINLYIGCTWGIESFFNARYSEVSLAVLDFGQ